MYSIIFNDWSSNMQRQSSLVDMTRTSLTSRVVDPDPGIFGRAGYGFFSGNGSG